MGLHWSEKEALRAQYPDFYVALLLEVLALVDAVEARELTGTEVAFRAKARFVDLMLEHLPECRTKVEAYRERVAAEEREKNAVAAAYEQRRQAAIRGERLRIEQAAADETKARYEQAVEAERRLKEQTAERIAAEEKERARKESDAAAAERQRVAEVDRLLKIIESEQSA